MAYAVVKFLNDDAVNEIPTNWISKEGNKTICWWPPANTKQLSSLILKRSEPDFKTWVQLPISIEKYCGTFEKARKVAEYASYTSTEEIELGKGHRKKLPNKLFCSDIEDSENEEDDINEGSNKKDSKAKIPQYSCSKVLPISQTDDIVDLTFPSLKTQSKRTYKKNKLPSKDIHINSDSEESNINSNQSQIKLPQWPCSKTPIPPKQQSEYLSIPNDNYYDKEESFSQTSSFSQNSRSTRQKDTENTKRDKYDQLINTVQNAEENTTILIKMTAKLQMQMKDVLQRIDRITPTIKITCPTKRVNSCLPLKSIKNIKEMETRLQDEDFLQEYKVFIQKIGGHTPKANVQNVLTRIFSNECSVECSWKGRALNFPIHKLYLITIMKEVILEIHATLTEKEIDDSAAEWFRFAKQRCNRELKQNCTD